MSSAGDKPGDFWSRRKAAVQKAEEAEVKRAQQVAEAEQRAALEEKTDAEILEELGLPDPDTLGKDDDFTAFLAKTVPERLRRRALRVIDPPPDAMKEGAELEAAGELDLSGERSLALVHTDIYESTTISKVSPKAFKEIQNVHDDIMRSCIRAHGAHEVLAAIHLDLEGDAVRKGPVL